MTSHYVVQFKLTQCCMSIIISIKLKKKLKSQLQNNRNVSWSSYSPLTYPLSSAAAILVLSSQKPNSQFCPQTKGRKSKPDCKLLCISALTCLKDT